MSAEQKRESHIASMRKYDRKAYALKIKQQKEKVVRKINKIKVEYNAEGLIKLELAI
jgi:type I site-specific restriction endonuclease